jgi:hypothetical protein
MTDGACRKGGTPMEQREHSPWGPLALVSGIIFIILQIVPGFFVPPPVGNVQAEKITTYLVAQRTGALTISLLDAFSFIFFLIFLGHLYCVLRQAEGSIGMLSLLAVIGGSITAATGLVWFALEVAATRVAGYGGTPDVARGLMVAAVTVEIFHSIPLLLFLIAASMAMLHTRIIPAWIAVIGLAASLAELVNLGATYKDGLGLFAFIGFGVTAVWIVGVGIALLRPRRAAHPVVVLPHTSPA